MDFIDKIQEIAARIPRQIEFIETEEATKNAFVMPFISALGFDVFNPLEVVPEFTADVGVKKGEKVDYAIMQNGKPIILFECKRVGTDLNKEHASQLTRYFTFTEARFGVLTNGVVYKFFADLEKPNKMDAKPFLELDMLDATPAVIEELKKFTKPKFDLDGILATASELKYTREIKRAMAQEWANPSEEFVRHFTKMVYTGLYHQAVKERFTVFVTQAAKQFTSDLVSDRLKSALSQETTPTTEEQPVEMQEETTPTREISTTQEEMEAFFVVKTILRDVINPRRVAMRDTLSYCGILFDDNNRRPICRLYFDRQQKFIGIFDNQKKEEKLAIVDVEDIYAFADKLKSVAAYYDQMG